MGIPAKRSAKNSAKKVFKDGKKKRGKKKSPLHPSYKERPPIL
jgi:hypothetical protein